LGEPLSQITRDFCRAWGIEHTVLPMSDEPVRTMVDTVDSGELPFQEYFVHRRCEPVVRGFRFAGLEAARPAPGVMNAIHAADAIVICPSNPWVSIDPILAVLGLRSAVDRPSSIFAVSPIIGGQTVKGPAAKMFAELGITPSAVAVGQHYGDLLAGLVLDQQDAGLAAVAGLPTFVTDTIMRTGEDRRRLARDVIDWIGVL
jgi:LPPG:FO 2-phospho-L-lactate transferase